VHISRLRARFVALLALFKGVPHSPGDS